MPDRIWCNLSKHWVYKDKNVSFCGKYCDNCKSKLTEEKFKERLDRCITYEEVDKTTFTHWWMHNQWLHLIADDERGIEILISHLNPSDVYGYSIFTKEGKRQCYLRSDIDYKEE